MFIFLPWNNVFGLIFFSSFPFTLLLGPTLAYAPPDGWVSVSCLCFSFHYLYSYPMSFSQVPDGDVLDLSLGTYTRRKDLLRESP